MSLLIKKGPIAPIVMPLHRQFLGKLLTLTSTDSGRAVTYSGQLVFDLLAEHRAHLVTLLSAKVAANFATTNTLLCLHRGQTAMAE